MVDKGSILQAFRKISAFVSTFFKALFSLLRTKIDFYAHGPDQKTTFIFYNK
jgi:hypothetical protein